MRIGLYSPFFGSTIGGGEKYLGVTAEAIRDAFPGHTVEIVSPVPADRERYERMLALDLAGVDLVATNRRVTRLHRLLNGIPAMRMYRDLIVSMQAVRFTRRYDLFLSMVYVMPAFSKARRSVILCQFPYQVGPVRRRKRGIPAPVYRLYTLPYDLLRPLLVGDELGVFEKVICQSQYVRRWVREYWGRDAEVVNPPIDVPEAEPEWGAKRNLILSVGRFFAAGHNKRHDLMVAAFKRLCDGGLEGWELHLAGSVHREAHNAGHFERIQESARGYPITLWPDAAHADVQRLYREASIYWHAAGYGVDPQTDPIDIEHFGMTTAEAMAAGAVPVVIGAGGQVEVVEDGVTGYLWTDPEELRERTLRLVAGGDLRRRLALAARESSHRFSRAEFKRRMAESLGPIVRDLEAGS